MPRTTVASRPGGYARGHQASDVTDPQYRRGWELWLAQLPEQEIRRQCRLTSGQYQWCLREGSEDMPAWLHLYADVAGKMRQSAAEAAKLVARDGLLAIRQALKNGAAAGDALGQILTRVRQDLLDADKAGFQKAMPSDEVLSTIRILSVAANVLPGIASTYRSIYGDSLRLSAADEALMAGEGTSAGIPSEFLEELSRMDDDQLDQYIAEGEEPARAALGPVPDEQVVDTEVVEPVPEPEPPPKRKKRAKRARKKTTVRKRSPAGGAGAGEAR